MSDLEEALQLIDEQETQIETLTAEIKKAVEINKQWESIVTTANEELEKLKLSSAEGGADTTASGECEAKLQAATARIQDITQQEVSVYQGDWTAAVQKVARGQVLQAVVVQEAAGRQKAVEHHKAVLARARGHTVDVALIFRKIETHLNTKAHFLDSLYFLQQLHKKYICIELIRFKVKKMNSLPHLQSMYEDSSSSSDESFSDGDVSVGKFNHLPFADDASSSDEEDFTSSDDESDFDDSILPGPLANLVRESSKKSTGIVVTDEGAEGSVIVTDIGNSSLLGSSSVLRAALPVETASVYSSSSSSSSSVETYIPATADAVSILSGFTSSTGSSASSLSTASSGNTIEIVTANVSAEEQLMVASADKIVKLRAQLVEAQTALASGGYSVGCPACAPATITAAGSSTPEITKVMQSYATVTDEQNKKLKALEESVKKLIEALQTRGQDVESIKKTYEDATAKANTAATESLAAKGVYEAAAKETGTTVPEEQQRTIDAAAAAEAARREEAEKVAAEAAKEQARREEAARVAAEAAAEQARREEADRVAAEAAAEQARREEADRKAAEATAEQKRREETETERVAAEAAGAEQSRRKEAERVAAEAAAKVAEEAAKVAEEAAKVAAGAIGGRGVTGQAPTGSTATQTAAERLAEKRQKFQQQNATVISLVAQIAAPPPTSTTPTSTPLTQ